MNKTKLVSLKPEHQEFLLSMLGRALNNTLLSMDEKVLAAEVVKAIKGRKGKPDAQD